MALIRITEADRQRARNPFHSALTFIGFEDAPSYTGEECGERIFLSPEDQERYGCPTSQDRQPPHSHIVVFGRDPLAGPWRYAVNKAAS
jgi:hypothetical protein